MNGEAGNRGTDVRSDCWIGIEKGGRGKKDGIEISSKVEVLYGESLRELLAEGIDRLGAAPAAVTLEDQGALPWVVMARLEAAVHSSGIEGADPWLPERRRAIAEPVRNRLRRSRLYLPGNTPRFMLNAGRHGPDGIILDLEDSVAPGRKDQARLLVRNALCALDFGYAEVMVRINQLPLGIGDLEAIVPQAPGMILIPKVEGPDQVQEVEAVCMKLAAEAEVPPPLLMPIVESAAGALHAYTIAAASSLVAAITIGLEDYTADLGVERTPEGTESLWARSRLVNAAVAAGVQPIDTVFSDVGDEEALRASVREAKQLGFVGKGCIHPRQIRPIHEAFAPSPEEIERALRIVGAWEEAQQRGDGVVSLGTKMIDAPVVARARRVVGSARDLGLIGREGGSDA